jgi:hypothetical protein
MCEAIVLSMSNFSQPIIFEINALDKGIRAVLMQGRRLMTYMSKALGINNQ